MPSAPLSMDDLSYQLEDFGQRFLSLENHQLFLLWFMRAYLTDDESRAANAITDGPRDKGIDALLIDDAASAVFITQGKFREVLGRYTEKRADVLTFARLAEVIADPNDAEFEAFVAGTTATANRKLRQARRRLRERNYRLCLYYVTIGKCSSSIEREAQQAIRRADCYASIEILDWKRVLRILRDYLDGVAPPIPTLDLEIEKGRAIETKGVLQRFDSTNQIESWVFPMKGDAIADIYHYAGVRLFARNIRGFLGATTSVNQGMTNTLQNEPDHFFYYNNGITILCDRAEKQSSRGRDILRVSNPQVINGQQTTRVLASSDRANQDASVLVKVVQVPKNIGEGDEFDNLVSRIVAGTNWQNAIRPSDLMANDRQQVEIERALRKIRYLYLRKRQTKGEALSSIGGTGYTAIKKEELARAVAGCDLDPVIVRSGVERLFEDDLYQQVFPNHDPKFYLPRYWLMREVAACSRGYPYRGYAKWLVLGFVWSNIAQNVRSKRNARSFWIQCEWKDPRLLVPLHRAVTRAFASAKRFYNANRGSGDRAVDISQFFKNKRGRNREFEIFWQGENETIRHAFYVNIAKVARAITEFDE